MKQAADSCKSRLDPELTVRRRKVRAWASLVIVSLAAGLLFSGCRRSGASTTLSEVCQEENGTFVTVEGFLQLPNFLDAEVDAETDVMIYDLLLSANPDGKSPIVRTRISGMRGNGANGIAELPADGYTQRDLRIFTASGETLGSSDRVRVSGELWKGRNKGEALCIVKTERIESLSK